ncbi:unnamed protein product, partial [Laminaria digitata]
MVPAVMDVCPELFCPEHRGAGPGPEESSALVQEIRGVPIATAFLRRAAGALRSAPSMATDVLRELLACPAGVLLSAGEEALKGMLPKIAGEYFPRQSTVASLCSSVWMRLYELHPNGQAMETWTLNALLQGDSDAALSRNVTYETMCREPVLIFRCRPEALSCPYLLRILLRVLRSLLLASERTIDQAVVAKERRWEMVSVSARRKKEKAVIEAAIAGSVAAASGGGGGGIQVWEDYEEDSSRVDGCMMLLIQQAIVARCLLVVALGGAGDSNSGGGGDKNGGGVFGGGIAPRTQ